MAARQNRLATIMNTRSSEKLGKRYTALVSTALAFASPFLPSHDAPVPPSPDGGEFTASLDIRDSPSAFKKSWEARSMKFKERGIAEGLQTPWSHMEESFERDLQWLPGFRELVDSKEALAPSDFAEIVKAAGAEATILEITVQGPQDAEPRQIYLDAFFKRSEGSQPEHSHKFKKVVSDPQAMIKAGCFKINKFQVNKDGLISETGRTEEENKEIFKFLASLGAAS